MNYINEWHLIREKIVNLYHESFKSINGMTLPSFSEPSYDAYHLYIVKIEPDFWKIARDQIIIELNKLGIGTSVHYIPVHMHSYYTRKYGYKPQDFPRAKELSETVISLPLYPGLSDDEVQYVIDIVFSIWEKYKV